MTRHLPSIEWLVPLLSLLLVLGPVVGSAGSAPAVDEDPALDAVREYRSVRDHEPVPAPVAVRIPRLDVDSDLVDLGIADDRTVEVPEDFQQAGWFSGAPKPGAPGAAAILGHVDSFDGPAVFFRLSELEPGDRIEVDRADGSTVVFEVERLEQHAKATFPTEDVWFPTPEPSLRLITCGGPFDRLANSYTDNVIVFATLMD